MFKIYKNLGKLKSGAILIQI